jgi:hypothetical protein
VHFIAVVNLELCNPLPNKIGLTTSTRLPLSEFGANRKFGGAALSLPDAVKSWGEVNDSREMHPSDVPLPPR